MLLGPGTPGDGFNQDGESIDASGVPQSGIFNNLGNLFASIAGDVAGTFRAVNNPTVPVAIQGSGANASLSVGTVSPLHNLLVPALIVVGIILIIPHL